MFSWIIDFWKAPDPIPAGSFFPQAAGAADPAGTNRLRDGALNARTPCIECGEGQSLLALAFARSLERFMGGLAPYRVRTAIVHQGAPTDTPACFWTRRLLLLPVNSEVLAREADLLTRLPVLILFGWTNKVHLEVTPAGHEQIGVHITQIADCRQQHGEASSAWSW